jgi:hypothetical protein
MPPLADLAERAPPASAAPRAPPVAAVTAPAAPARAEAASESTRSDAAAAANDELAARAETWRRERLPAVAAAAERQLAHVLAVAARSAEFRRRSDVRAAARAMRSATPPAPPSATTQGALARTLNDEALMAYGRSNGAADALALQTRAFGANPFDSEVAGNLAFLLLKQQPPETEAARRFALHALTLNDVRFPSGRTDDWTTLAIASALTGHEDEARDAWYVALALTADLPRLCSVAVSAEASHGERLQPSVQAMLQRVRSSAAYGRCEAAGTEPKQRDKAPDKAAPRRGRPIP